MDMMQRLVQEFKLSSVLQLLAVFSEWSVSLLVSDAIREIRKRIVPSVQLKVMVGGLATGVRQLCPRSNNFIRITSHRWRSDILKLGGLILFLIIAQEKSYYFCSILFFFNIEYNFWLCMVSK